MENASKALIIAGAILISILIIGLGVFIYNQAANTFDSTGLDQLTIQQFNAQFEPYEGEQLGMGVRQLIQKVMSNNYTYANDDSMIVKVNNEKPGDSSKLNGRTIGFADTYTVEFDKNPRNGLITNISIDDGSGQTGSNIIHMNTIATNEIFNPTK